MQDSSKKVVLEILDQRRPKTLLDAPSGDGWLKKLLSYTATIDGIDLFETTISGYRSIFNFDLNRGIPAETGQPKYDAVVCCEGLEHFGNPLLFLESAREQLTDNGFLVITTPNIWYPAARLQFLFRGFFPSFPCLTGRIIHGTHMHIMPWSFPQLYLYLVLAGFTDIELHDEPLSKPKHFWERALAIPQRIYCRNRERRALDLEEKNFWRIASQRGSLLGRHLIMTARPVKPADNPAE